MVFLTARPKNPLESRKTKTAGRRGTFDNPGHTIARNLAGGRVSVDQRCTASQLSAQNRKIAQPRSRQPRHDILHDLFLHDCTAAKASCAASLAASKATTHRLRRLESSSRRAAYPATRWLKRMNRPAYSSFSRSLTRLAQSRCSAAQTQRPPLRAARLFWRRGPACRILAASKLQLTLSMTQHGPTTAPLMYCDATSYPTP